MESKVFGPDFIRRVRDEYVGSWVTLRQLSAQSEEMFGQFVSVDTIKKWSDHDNWPERRRKARVLCPHCQEDITQVVAGHEIDVSFMYKYLVTRAFDEMTTAEKLNPVNIQAWRTLVKEAGMKPTVGQQSAMSDLDLVLEEIGKHDD